jgi:hypothetical protein
MWAYGIFFGEIKLIIPLTLSNVHTKLGINYKLDVVYTYRPMYTNVILLYYNNLRVRTVQLV